MNPDYDLMVTNILRDWKDDPRKYHMELTPSQIDDLLDDFLFAIAKRDPTERLDELIVVMNKIEADQDWRASIIADKLCKPVEYKEKR